MNRSDAAQQEIARGVFIISRAHEVVQDTPETMFHGAQRLVCMRCGLRGDAAALFGAQRCAPAIYEASSGWRDEDTAEERAALDAMARK